MSLSLRALAPALLLFAIAAGVRVTALASPAEVVFDEVHFGTFVTAYCCTHERHFDIHPPAGKLLAAGAARLFGYEGGPSFSSIGEPLPSAAAWQLRLFPALMGALLPVLVWGFARRLGASDAGALLAGFAVALDNAHVVQSRLLALDPLLAVASIGSVWAAVSATHRRDLKRAALAGALAGLAFGAKFLGAAAIATSGLVLLLESTLTHRERLRSVLAFALACATVYLVPWWIHFALQTAAGPGDAFFVPTGRFFPDLLALHERMVSANDNLAYPHPNASPAWSWPFMARSVFYWQRDGALLYLLGNPVVWWGSTLALLAAVSVLALMRRSNLTIAGEEQGPSSRRLWIPLAGFAWSYLPFAFVSRGMFLYHYLVPLLFAVLAAVLFLERIGWLPPGPIGSRPPRYYVLLAAVTAGFFSIAPLTYGWPLPDSYGRVVFDLFPSWR